MVYMINPYEFQETDASFSLDTNNKRKSRQFEKTIPLIQIISDKCMHGNYIPL